MADDTTPGPLTYSELKRACANVGVDLECGCCAAQFFSGVVFDADVHTCKPTRTQRHNTASEERLLAIILQRNRSMTLYRDDLDDQQDLLRETRRKFYELRDDLLTYGRHHNECAKAKTGICACGFDEAVAKNTPPDRDPVAERIAKWVLGYGKEPMDATLVAAAIREGKWR